MRRRLSARTLRANAGRNHEGGCVSIRAVPARGAVPPADGREPPLHPGGRCSVRSPGVRDGERIVRDKAVPSADGREPPLHRGRRCSVRSPGFRDGERIFRAERFLPPTEENRHYTGGRRCSVRSPDVFGGERIVRQERFDLRWLRCVPAGPAGCPSDWCPLRRCCS